MTAVILSRTEKSFILQIEVPVDADNMLSSEELLQDQLVFMVTPFIFYPYLHLPDVFRAQAIPQSTQLA